MAFTPRRSIAAVASLALAILSIPAARAAENYVIPASDGYGIGECMHAGVDCGRVIADSWCESHGHAHVLAFGTVEDVTGSIQASNKPEPVTAAPGDIVIRCGD
jgi:hypothetical protein